MIKSKVRYATIEDLTRRASVDDLAERTSPENSAVTGALLGEKIDGGTLSRESAATRGAVELAVARLNQLLDDASAEIDGYISRLLPLDDPPPPAIKLRCLDIALYRLFGGEGGREKIHTGAVAWLRQIGDGKIALVESDGADANGNDVLIDAGKRVFDQKTLDGFTA